MIDPEIETIPMQRMRLRDSVQHYTNMLTCIHDLKDTERDQIVSWLTIAENELESLPTEDHVEVAIHP